MSRLLNQLPSRSRGYVCRSCFGRLSTRATRHFSITSGAYRKALPRASPISTTSLSSSKSFSTTAINLAKGHSTRELLPSGPARTRFAPSPTGYLHLGSLRTALFNYLLAKRTGGQFLLRIEDTDQKRLVPDAEQRLCDDLRWAGIQWDEGPQVGGPYGPYKQSERTPLYQKHAQELVDAKAAFRCFCSSTAQAPVDVDASLVGSAIGGCHSDCASIPLEESTERARNEKHAVRFGKPDKAPSWSDLVYGKVSLESKKTLPQRAAVEGVILLKGDGTPTYHLANVIDDHYMRITHVIRGTEWMSSTPLHAALYNAFGWTPPAFAHVGLLTDKDQAKLSKRNFDTDIGALKTKHGILPESLANFLALLGWRNPTRDDVMEMNKLIELFDLKFTKGNSIVSFDKLWFLQKNHAKIIIERAMQFSTADPSFENLLDLLESAARTAYPNSRALATQDLRIYMTKILFIDAKTYENPSSYVERNAYFFTTSPPASPSPDTSISKSDLHTAAMDVLKNFDQTVTNSNVIISAPTYTEIKTRLDATIAEYAKVIGEVIQQRATVDGEVDKTRMKEWSKHLHHYLREKLCFGRPGPGSSQVMAVLGHEECWRRLEV
ncbi:hypothetical protein D6C84_04515 [Aureobasidium pullulans]|uniref:Glutamate--tRNA ligase, mitochondrial n=1 Tax=Aureobasidium pullulans TaxID=5580 RepID=A0A4S9XY12_AURPU|nr:hypothetical protein D6C84_04515 [Aureobasidium pullulans]